MYSTEDFELYYNQDPDEFNEGFHHFVFALKTLSETWYDRHPEKTPLNLGFQFGAYMAAQHIQNIIKATEVAKENAQTIDQVLRQRLEDLYNM